MRLINEMKNAVEDEERASDSITRLLQSGDDMRSVSMLLEMFNL